MFSGLHWYQWLALAALLDLAVAISYGLARAGSLLHSRLPSHCRHS